MRGLVCACVCVHVRVWHPRERADGNNSRLDAPGFSPVGTVDAAGMAVVDALYAGYGEVKDLCGAGATDPFCVGTGDACKGVDMAALVKGGDAYLKSYPMLTRVTSTVLHSKR